MPTSPGVSIVIPVYNSEGSLRVLIDEIAAAREMIGEQVEVILVNDGSRDQSWQVICDLSGQYDWLRAVNLTRNYGQHNATLCGVRLARYDVTVTMDDDLQHPPSEVPKLVAAVRDDSDVAYGMPSEMPHSGWRNLGSKIAKWCISIAMQREFPYVGAFRAFRTSLREAFQDCRSPHILLDVVLSWATTSVVAIPVVHRTRTIGRSGYSVRRLIGHGILALTAFSTAPLRLASWVGFSFVAFGILVLAYVVGRFFLDGSLPGFPFLASIIALFSGAQLFTLGVFGEYLARIYERTVDRPPYVIRTSLRIDRTGS